MKRFFAALATLAIVAAPAVAQDATPEAPSDQPIEGVAALVNDEPISFGDVRARARLLLLGLQAQPDQATIQRITNQAVEQLIDERLQLQKAREFDLTVDDSDVALSMADMAQANNSTVEALYAELRSAGINPATLEDQIRADIAWRRIMSGLYGRNIRISDTQIDDRLAQIRAGVGTTRYQLSEIFLYAPEGERRQQAIELARTLVDQFGQGVSFEMAAQRFSASATAATGGDMGWVNAIELEPEVRVVIEAMAEPGYTAPIETPQGIYLYAVRNKQEPQDGKTMVEIKQLIARDGSRLALDEAIAAGANCNNLIETAEADENLAAIEIGKVDPETLTEDNQTRIAETETGAPSVPFEVRNGLAVTFVCGREQGGVELPSREQIENQLYGQQLAMISDRELRDLKREALIIRR